MNEPDADKRIFTDRQSRNFWSKVDKTEGCWNWTGSRDGRRRYGLFHLNTGMAAAHRVSFEVHRRVLRPGEMVLHRCDNPQCVNPGHLFTGTQVDNMNDMHSKGRGPNQKGVLNGNSKLNEDAVREIRRAHSVGESKRGLGRRFGVTMTTITRIVRRVHWGSVTD